MTMARARKKAGQEANSSAGQKAPTNKKGKKKSRPDKIVVRFNPSIPQETLDKWEKVVKDYFASKKSQ
jgi:hypothetical protein